MDFKGRVEAVLTALGVSAGWSAPAITLGDFEKNGVSVFLSSVGALYTFDPNQNDEIVINIPLNHAGLEYDGSNIKLRLNWQMFSAAAPGNNIQGELDYAFISDGDDNYTKNDGKKTMLIDCDTITHREQQTSEFESFSGPVGAKLLQLTLRRIGLTDTYGGDVDFYGASIIKD